MNKEKESKKFPLVITTSSLFGMDKGTKLEFDFNTGKYVSVTEAEDIGPGESYFYSGSAIALDPYLVRRSIGIDFKYGEEVEVDEKKYIVGADPYEEKPKPEVEIWDVADLVTICGQCGTVTPVFTVEKATQFTMTTRSDSTIILTCPNCKNEMSLAMRNGKVLDKKEATPEDLDNAMRGEAIELSEKEKSEKPLKKKEKKIIDKIVAEEEQKAVDRYLEYEANEERLTKGEKNELTVEKHTDSKYEDGHRPSEDEPDSSIFDNSGWTDEEINELDKEIEDEPQEESNE